jgi:hypothetical protein
MKKKLNAKLKKPSTVFDYICRKKEINKKQGR